MAEALGWGRVQESTDDDELKAKKALWSKDWAGMSGEEGGEVVQQRLREALTKKGSRVLDVATHLGGSNPYTQTLDCMWHVAVAAPSVCVCVCVLPALAAPSCLLLPLLRVLRVRCCFHSLTT